jgi:hypothetical protein
MPAANYVCLCSIARRLGGRGLIALYERTLAFFDLASADSTPLWQRCCRLDRKLWEYYDVGCFGQRTNLDISRIHYLGNHVRSPDFR